MVARLALLLVALFASPVAALQLTPGVVRHASRASACSPRMALPSVKDAEALSLEELQQEIENAEKVRWGHRAQLAWRRSPAHAPHRAPLPSGSLW